MTTAIIIPIYKDLEALDIIIEAIQNQTILPDEIIIAEDNDSPKTKTFIDDIKIDGVDIKHTYQKDQGWRRNKSTNNALKVVNSDYLIFIDGDCVPYPTLVEYHKALAKKDAVLCGRRTEPGEYFSTLLRKKEMSVDYFIKNYYKLYFKLKKDNVKHYDGGISFEPNSLALKTIYNFRKKANHLVGCHWSVWKKDLEKINGFDEDFILPTHGEDTDIERRLRAIGVKFESCRFCACVVHLYHDKVFNNDITTKTKALMDSKKDIFICKNGIKKL
jgi:glycosyltransferase involved in cell wall biosynthesis